MSRVIAAGAMSAPPTPCTAHPAIFTEAVPAITDLADQRRSVGDEHPSRPEQVGQPPAHPPKTTT
ncbi:hypothetical protein [Nonomuraea sp. NPDC001699]